MKCAQHGETTLAVCPECGEEADPPDETREPVTYRLHGRMPWHIKWRMFMGEAETVRTLGGKREGAYRLRNAPSLRVKSEVTAIRAIVREADAIRAICGEG